MIKQKRDRFGNIVTEANNSANPTPSGPPPIKKSTPGSTPNSQSPNGPPPIRRKPKAADTPAAEQNAAPLPVAWLVVVSGPGRGNYMHIGFGWNSIGREANAGNAVVLNFGDATISATDHARINYDTESGAFSIVHQDGLNNTRVNNKHLDTPYTLTGGERITIGSTELRFVPLCNADFTWD